MDISRIYRFLNELKANNNREWFQEHKDEYEQVRREFDSLLTIVIARISEFDETVRGIQPKDCTYRIYRDTRFSADKTPYKTHLGGYINSKGKKSNHCGYYIHLEPGASLLAGGSICMPPKLLKAIREAIYYNIDEYIAIVEDPEFKKYFPVAGYNPLKTAPKGFPKDFPYIDYLKPREFTCMYEVSDDFFMADEKPLLDNIERVFRQMRPYADFMNYTIDDFEDE